MTNDGVICRGAINDKEIDLLSELLRYVPMVTGKVMVLMGKTLVPLNPTNDTFEGCRHSQSTIICWNAG